MGHPTPIDQQRLASDKITHGAGKKEHSIGNILWPSAPLNSLALQNEGVITFWVRMNLLGICWESAWGNTIDINILCPYLTCQRAGKANNGSFGRNIVE